MTTTKTKPRTSKRPKRQQTLHSAATALEDGSVETVARAIEDEEEVVSGDKTRLKRLLEEVNDLRSREKVAHAEHQEIVKDRKAAQLELEKAVGEIVNCTPGPLFDGKPGTNGKHVPVEQDDSWKTVTLEQAMPDLPLSILAKLENGETKHGERIAFKTLGELAAWQAKADSQLGNIKGLGPANAAKVEEALDTFWTRRNAVADVVQEVAEATKEPETATADDASEDNEVTESRE